MNAGTSRPLVGLVILDGWGLRASREGNAVALARTPVLDALKARYPQATLTTCGGAVGLPPGQMGNSEVGHLNLGAGRIVYQDLTRINRAVADGSLATNRVFREALDRAKKRGRIHFVGLLSPGGVHSHEKHAQEMIRLAAAAGVSRVLVHAILDGRDTPPRSAKRSLEETEALLKAHGGEIATISGRFYAMDNVQTASQLVLEFTLDVATFIKGGKFIESFERLFKLLDASGFSFDLIVDSTGTIKFSFL